MAYRTLAVRPVKRSERLTWWLSNYWLAAFIVAWGVFVILPWLAPVFMKIGLPSLGNGIYFLYQFVCHQLPSDPSSCLAHNLCIPCSKWARSGR